MGSVAEQSGGGTSKGGGWWCFGKWWSLVWVGDVIGEQGGVETGCAAVGTNGVVEGGEGVCARMDG